MKRDRNCDVRYLNEPDGICEDGDHVAVNVMVCDGGTRRSVAFDAADHQPGYRSGERYMHAYRQYCRDAGLPEHPDPKPMRGTADGDPADRGAAYDGYVKQLTEAYKRPPAIGINDAPQPDNGSSLPEWRRHYVPDPDPAATMRGHLSTESGAESQAKRDLAWIRYRDNLANAWKSDPRAATAIERQGERWRGGR
jgi:hypothetical protein